MNFSDEQLWELALYPSQTCRKMEVDPHDVVQALATTLANLRPLLPLISQARMVDAYYTLDESAFKAWEAWRAQQDEPAP